MLGIAKVLIAGTVFILKIYVGQDSHELGDEGLLNSFYSTVAVRLEDGKWGSRFPVIMNELSKKKLKYDRAAAALKELSVIEREFRERPPGDIVWDFKNRDARPPWSEALHRDVGTLDNCFITVEYKNLLKIFRKMLDQSRRMHETVYIQEAY